jgi:plastocyanin
MIHLPGLPADRGLPMHALHRARSTTLRAAIACGVALCASAPALAGTVVRGTVQMPLAAALKSPAADGLARLPIASDAVIYVTEAPGNKGSRLPGRGKTMDIELHGDQLVPRTINITVRSKVRFKNHDRVYHSLLGVGAAGRSDLGSIAPGKKREVRFDHPGVVNLFCQLHPASDGFVIVCPNWYHTRVSASGGYALPPLPRGSYIVHAWHPALGERRRAIEVTGRDIAQLDLSF